MEPIKVGMRPTHPGTFIREEVLNALGLSVADAAEKLHVRRATLSDLLNENADLSKEMAFNIEKTFGIDMQMLLNMQVWHDTFMARRGGKLAPKNKKGFGLAATRRARKKPAHRVTARKRA